MDYFRSTEFSTESLNFDENEGLVALSNRFDIKTFLVIFGVKFAKIYRLKFRRKIGPRPKKCVECAKGQENGFQSVGLCTSFIEL